MEAAAPPPPPPPPQRSIREIITKEINQQLQQSQERILWLEKLNQQLLHENKLLKRTVIVKECQLNYAIGNRNAIDQKYQRLERCYVKLMAKSDVSTFSDIETNSESDDESSNDEAAPSSLTGRTAAQPSHSTTINIDTVDCMWPISQPSNDNGASNNSNLNRCEAGCSSKFVLATICSSPCTKSFECYSCKKAFIDEKNLRIHFMRNCAAPLASLLFEDTAKICEYCGKSFRAETNLKVHLRIHRDEKPFVCHMDACSFKCTTKSLLNVHQKRHSSQKDFFCDKCNTRFIYSANLSRHKRLYCKKR